MIVPVYTDLLLDYPNSVSDRTQSALTYWRPSEASETLSGLYKFELVRYVLEYPCSVSDRTQSTMIYYRISLFSLRQNTVYTDLLLEYPCSVSDRTQSALTYY